MVAVSADELLRRETTSIGAESVGMSIRHKNGRLITRFKELKVKARMRGSAVHINEAIK